MTQINLEKLSIREFGRMVSRMKPVTITVELGTEDPKAVRTFFMAGSLPGDEAWSNTMKLVEEQANTDFINLAFSLTRANGIVYSIRTEPNDYFCRINLWWPIKYRRPEAKINTAQYPPSLYM